ncbi:MAG: hypothetical protein ACREQ8_11035 [Woeseiaceae bacterium]
MLAVIVTIGIAGMLAAAIGLSIGASDTIPDSTTPSAAVKVHNDSPGQTISNVKSEDQQEDMSAIEFPDGEHVTFRLRTPPRLQSPRDEKVVDVYDELSAAANLGDADAAMVLSNLLNECSMAHRSEQELNHAIDVLYQTHTVILPGSERPATVVGTDDMRVVEQRIRKQYEQCRGLSDKQIDQADRLLQQAATLGNSHALMSVAQTMLGHRDPKAEHYLEMAWLAGDLEAASHLWYFYCNAPPGRQDLVKGYAYKYVHDHVLRTAIENGAILRGPPMSTDSTEDASLRLNSRQEREALSLAKELLRQNPLCCFSNRLAISSAAQAAARSKPQG